MGSLGYSEMLVFGVVALLLFGSRLPEMARKLGGTYRELKKSVNEFQREFQAIDQYEPPKRKSEPSVEQRVSETTAPKFTPPPMDDD